MENEDKQGKPTKTSSSEMVDSINAPMNEALQ